MMKINPICINSLKDQNQPNQNEENPKCTNQSNFEISEKKDKFELSQE